MDSEPTPLSGHAAYSALIDNYRLLVQNDVEFATLRATGLEFDPFTSRPLVNVLTDIHKSRFCYLAGFVSQMMLGAKDSQYEITAPPAKILDLHDNIREMTEKLLDDVQELDQVGFVCDPAHVQKIKMVTSGIEAILTCEPEDRERKANLVCGLHYARN